MDAKTRLASQVFAGIAHSYAHLFVLLFATVVLVLEHDWAMRYDTLFALSIPMTVLFGAGALPAGWLADRWSETGMLSIYFFGLGGATVLTGLADGPWTLAAGLALMGLFASIYHPVGIPWLVKHAPNRGRALGVNGVFGSAGTAAAALCAGALASWYGWRAAFIAPGVFCLATGIVFVAACRLGLFASETAVARDETPAPARDVRRVFIVLAVTVLCSGMIYQVTSFALPKIFDDRLSGALGDSVRGIGGMVSVVYLASALSQIVGGEMADRFRLRTVYMAFNFLQVPMLAVAFVLVSPALVAVSALMVSLNVAGQPAENALLARYAPARWHGRVFGAKFMLTLGVSSLGVMLIPLAYRLTGALDIMFLVLIGFAVTAGIAAMCLPRAVSGSAPAAARLPAE
jgi:MFS family permease